VILQVTVQSLTKEITTMTAEDPHSINLSAFIAERLERAEPDLLRSMLSSFVQASESSALSPTAPITRAAESPSVGRLRRSADVA
jgi:hypothetical protein